MKATLKSVICFQLWNHVCFCLLFCFRKNVTKLLRNLEYSKAQKGKKLLPKLLFKKVYTL